MQNDKQTFTPQRLH